MNLEAHKQSILSSFRKAKKKLIFLDYDGTLAPFSLRPEEARPSLSLLKTLQDLSGNPLQQVVIISGRDRQSLEDWLAHLPLTLVAEHGAYYKTYHREWRSYETRNPEWKKKIRVALDELAHHYPGTHVEEKAYSCVWHFRALKDSLPVSDIEKITRMLAVEGKLHGFVVYPGEMAVELRTPGIDKGSFAQSWLEKHPSDFVMAMGDGETDEDLFAALGNGHLTIKVGPSAQSNAGFFLESQEQVLPFLNDLVSAMGTQVEI